MSVQTLTTGEIAKYCGVNFRTVIRWIKRGHLRAYQLPGRGDNRVYMQDFLAFLNENKLPTPSELQQHTRKVLICETDVAHANDLSEALQELGYDVRIANDGVLAGAQIETFAPSIVAIDFRDFNPDGEEIISYVRDQERLNGIRFLALGDAPENDAVDAILPKPFNKSAFVASIQKLKEAA